MRAALNMRAPLWISTYPGEIGGEASEHCSLAAAASMHMHLVPQWQVAWAQSPGVDDDPILFAVALRYKTRRRFAAHTELDDAARRNIAYCWD